MSADVFAALTLLRTTSGRSLGMEVKEVRIVFMIEQQLLPIRPLCNDRQDQSKLAVV